MSIADDISHPIAEHYATLPAFLQLFSDFFASCRLSLNVHFQPTPESEPLWPAWANMLRNIKAKNIDNQGDPCFHPGPYLRYVVPALNLNPHIKSIKSAPYLHLLRHSKPGTQNSRNITIDCHSRDWTDMDLKELSRYLEVVPRSGLVISFDATPT